MLELIAYINDMESFVDGGLIVERKSSINLSRDFARNDFEDFFAKLNEQSIKCSINLLIDIFALIKRSVSASVISFNRGERMIWFTDVRLAVLDGNIHQLGIFGFFGRCQNQGWVGSSILGFVLVDCCEVA